jgi:hypothetical protein
LALHGNDPWRHSGQARQSVVRPALIIRYTYLETCVRFICYTCTDVDIPDSNMWGLGADDAPYWDSNMVPKATVRIGHGRTVTIKPRVSTRSYTLMVTIGYTGYGLVDPAFCLRRQRHFQPTRENKGIALMRVSSNLTLLFRKGIYENYIDFPKVVELPMEVCMTRGASFSA